MSRNQVSPPAGRDDENTLAARPAALDALPLHRMPDRDLWPGIAARLPSRRRRRSAQERWLPAALAASLVVTALVGLTLRQAAPVTIAATVPRAPTISAPTPVTDWNDIESRGVQISQRSLRTLRGQWPEPSTDDDFGQGLMKATYRPQDGGGLGGHAQQGYLRAHLRLVEQAEREVRRALRQQPESAGLQELLATAEQQRARLSALIDDER
jgi:hypothetical protein